MTPGYPDMVKRTVTYATDVETESTMVRRDQRHFAKQSFLFLPRK